MARLKLQLNLSSVLNTIERRSGELAVELASLQQANINLRVERGFGVRDQRMPKYTPEYAAFRKKRGRESAPRTLSFRGRMLGDMHVRKTGPSNARIFFATKLQRVKALTHQNRSPWFGISKKDEKILRRFLKQRGIT